MFLALLSGNQKRLFMSLAYDLAVSDGDFCENEKMAIREYSREMEIEMKLEEADKDIDHVISEMNNICGEREKKIIVFEIIGLAMADHNYDDGEREIVKKALNIFELEQEFGDYCEKKLSEYFQLQEELNSRILG